MTKVIMCAGNEYCVDPDGSVRQRATFYIHAVPGQPLPTDGARNADKLVILNWNELSEAQKAFLETTSGKFVIIGGTGAVSADVEAELDAIGDVTRVKGANRYGTSVEIAKRYFTNPESAVLAYAQGFPDGLCGGPLALSMGAPLILTSNDSFAAADDYVTGISSGAVTGGTSRISDDTVRAIFDLSPDTPVVKP